MKAIERAGRGEAKRLHRAGYPGMPFEARLLRVSVSMPSGGSRFLLYLIGAMVVSLLAAAVFGRIDVVASANGKLVPSTLLKVVQPLDAGVVREILVAEGTEVAAGQVIFRMDTQLNQADRRILANELTLRRLQLRRIEAELSGTPFERKADDPQQLHLQVLAQFNARRRAHLDALDSERSVLAKARQELRGAEEVESKLRRVAPIYTQQEQAWNQLAKEGYAGKLLALERSRSRIENEQDLQAQAAAVSGARAAISATELRLAQLDSGYRRELSNERVEVLAQIERLQEDLGKQTHRGAQLELRAPTSGVVKDLATRTPGTVVAPGTILATIVPREEPLEAEVWIENRDIGHVTPGARVALKITAYPYQHYGTVPGTVRHLGADATERPEPAAPGSGTMSLHYRALVSLDVPPSGESARLRLAPGMQLAAEMHLGTRTVFEYLVSPLRKAIHEAAREP